MAQLLAHKDRHKHFISSHSTWYVTICLELLARDSAIGGWK